jgi:hypothetical protein
MSEKRSEVTSRDRVQSACPFLAKEDAGASCLSQSDETFQVAPAYVSSVCLKARHFTCPRFLRADGNARLAARARESADSSAPPESPDAASVPASTERGQAETPEPSNAGQAVPALEQERRHMPVIRRPSNGEHSGANLTLWGTSNPGGSIDILDGVKHVATAGVDDAGFWGAILRDLTPGTHQLRARTFVDGGTVSRFSQPVSIIVESVAPPPTESGLETQAHEDVPAGAAVPRVVEAESANGNVSVNGRPDGAAIEEAHKAEETRRAEANRLAEEARRAAEARAAEEAARQAEVARVAEEARRADEARLAEEARQAEEARRAEEAQRAEEARLAAEARRADEARTAEAARQAEEARRAEEARQAEEARRAEEARIEAEARRAEEERRLEEARRAEEARAAAEAERLAEEARRAEEGRRAKELARREEEARRAEEARQAELARRAEEARRVEEARKAEEARAQELARAEAARQAAEARQREDARLEQARNAEAARLIHDARVAAEARRLEEARQAEAALAALVAEQAEATRQAEARAAEARRQSDATAPSAEAPAPPDQETDQSRMAGAVSEDSTEPTIRRKGGLSPLLLVAAGVVLIAAGAVVQLTLHPFGQKSSVSHTAKALPAVAPAPARSWHFGAVSTPSDQTIVVVNNPGSGAAKITITTGATVQHVTLQPQGESEMELPPQQRAGAIAVSSSAPIIVERIDVRKGKTFTSYGTHT